MLRIRLIPVSVVGLMVGPAVACGQTPPNAAPPTAAAPGVTNAWFDDDFSRGNRCARRDGEGGFGWGEANYSRRDTVVVVRDPASPSGCALSFIYHGSPDPADDAWAEQRFRLGKVNGEALREVFVGFVLLAPADYVHRAAKGPDNNKLLRLWDQDYQGSVIHVGMSSLGKRGASGSRLIVEYRHGATGNYNTGPWSPIFTPGKADTLGFYVRAASGVDIPDGVIRVWLNRALIYERSNLPLANKPKAGGGYNGIGNGYLLGWANSGFDRRTDFHVWRFIIAPTPPPWFLPAR